MQRGSNGTIKQEAADQPSTVGPNNNGRKYTCETCEITFFSRSGISRHFRTKHLGFSRAQEKTEICTICGIYCTVRNFKEHVESHSTARNFKCELCGAAVKSIFTLRKHIKRVHMKVPVMKTKCDLCDKISTPAAIKKHKLRYHNEGGNITCEVCGKQSLTVYDQNCHMKIHSADNKYRCDLCNIRFISKASFKVHFIKHKSEWSYECGMCSKVFKHSSSVSGHRKSHKVDGYYHCGCCDDRFEDYGQLKTHFVFSGHSFCSKIKREETK